MPEPPRNTRRQFGRNLAALVPLAAAGTPGLHAALGAFYPVWNPLDFGAKGDGLTNDTAAIQKAIDACAGAGGGTVLLPAHGAFLSGSLTLKSHVRFHLEGGSRLVASTNRDHFRAVGSLLFAQDADGIEVSGTGEVLGNDKAFFPPKSPDGYPVPQSFLGPFDPLYDESRRNPADGRPRMILLVNCDLPDVLYQSVSYCSAAISEVRWPSLEVWRSGKRVVVPTSPCPLL